jgi:hypothetical protein
MSKIAVELPETFFEGEQEVRKPSFRQKAALAELQALCFLQVKTSDYVPGFKRLIRATASVVDCEDFSEELKPNLHHPLFWRALGFYSEDPMVTFKYYIRRAVHSSRRRQQQEEAVLCGGLQHGS